MKRPSGDEREVLKAGRHLRVAAADFVRNVGHWQSEALQEPISITYHGRVRLMLATPEHFESGQQKESVEDLERMRRDAYAHRALSSFSSIGIAELKDDLTVDTINVIGGNILGRNPFEMIGQSLSGFLPPAGAPVFDALLREVALAGVPREMTTEGSDQRHIWLQIIPTGLAYVVFIRDHTNLIRLQKDAGSYQALSGAIAALGGIAELRVDRRGRVISATNALTDLLGLTPNEVNDTRVMDLVKFGDKRRLHLAAEAASFNGESSQFVIAMTTKEGTDKQVRVVVTPILEDAAPVGACLLVTPEAAEQGRGSRLNAAAAPYAR